MCECNQVMPQARFLLRDRAQSFIRCLHIEIQTIGDSFYTLGGCQQNKPPCRLSPTPLFLCTVSISSARSGMSQFAPRTRSNRTRKALASCVRPWMLSCQGEAGRNLSQRGGYMELFFPARGNIVDAVIRVSRS